MTFIGMHRLKRIRNVTTHPLLMAFAQRLTGR